jgi:hypothetical protein
MRWVVTPGPTVRSCGVEAPNGGSAGFGQMRPRLTAAARAVVIAAWKDPSYGASAWTARLKAELW